MGGDGDSAGTYFVSIEDFEWRNDPPESDDSEPPDPSPNDSPGKRPKAARSEP